jgi:hypothetical protein
MKTRKSVYVRCDACGAAIHYGNTSVSFARNVEQVDRTPEHLDGLVTVADSCELITLCATCGNQFSTQRATVVLKAALNQPEITRN